VLRKTLTVLSLVFVALWVIVIALPGLNQDTTINPTIVERGNIIFVHANWTENVTGSFIEYDVTPGSGFGNYTFDCITGCNVSTWSNVTNYSITTNNSFSLGNHSARIYVTSTQESGSLDNITSSFVIFTITGDGIPSTSSKFEISPPSMRLNFTNNFTDNLTLRANSGISIAIINTTTGIKRLYSFYKQFVSFWFLLHLSLLMY